MKSFLKILMILWYPVLILQLIILYLYSVIVGSITSMETMDKGLKYVYRIFVILALIRVKVIGAEKLDKKKGYLFMPNHVSFLDPFVVEAYFPLCIRGVETQRHFDWPVYGNFIRISGNIPINQKSLRDSIKSMRVAQEYIEKGRSVVIFPEGTRTHDGKLGEFKRLPFIVAKEAGREIYPMGLIGLHEILPRGAKLIRPGKVTIIVGDPVPADVVKSLDTNELCALMRQRIADLIGEDISKG